MKMRSYFGVFLVVCLFGGYLSAYVVVDQYSREKEASRRFADSKLAVKDVERLAGHLRQLIVTADLILASGVTYLAANAVENAELIAADLRAMRIDPFYRGSEHELTKLLESVGIVQLVIRKAGTLDFERDGSEVSKLLTRSDTAAEELISALDRLEQQLATMVQANQISVDSASRHSKLITLVVSCLFSLWIFIIWLWTASKISLPVQRLSERAEDALDHAGVFEEIQRGPFEVKQLSEKLNRLIGHLEEEVANRTEELTRSKNRLEETNKQLEEEIHQHFLSDARFASAFNNAAIGMAIINLDGQIVKFNASFQSFFGSSESVLLNVQYTTLLFKKERGLFEEQFAQLTDQKISQIQLQQQYYDDSGNGIWGLLSASLVTDERGEPSYSIFQLQDITDSYELSEKLTYQAQHDALTGLYNRYEFEKRLKEFISDAEMSQGDSTHVLCYLDLDQFKVVNDTCGHIAGDELLKIVANCLTLNLRDADIVARLGGDEFGLLLRNCPREKALEIADKIRERIHEERYQHGDKIFRVGISMGMAIIDGDGLAHSDLMSAADTACYMAKEAGRNRVHIFDLNDDVLAVRTKEMNVVGKINHALEDGRFFLLRQPIVPLNDRLSCEGIRYYEILLRMQDKDGKTVSPGLFLPAAERYHLASRIDRWVVETSLRYLCESSSADKVEEKYAINLSGQSLTNKELLKDIASIVKNARLPRTEICFEITETAAISNLKNARIFIEELKALGCTFSLDDFGRGLSSFGYLKTLPVDYLKIDGEFVRDILLDRIDLAMVKSINEVAHAGGKLTVAEFVESEEIARVLTKIGIDYAQGYYFGKPEAWIQFETEQFQERSAAASVPCA
jgi:diguanylate cyclase (GGDEF)-like protein/PAS domain S-box-containing protein